MPTHRVACVVLQALQSILQEPPAEMSIATYCAGCSRSNSPLGLLAVAGARSMSVAPAPPPSRCLVHIARKSALGARSGSTRAIRRWPRKGASQANRRSTSMPPARAAALHERNLAACARTALPVTEVLLRFAGRRALFEAICELPEYYLTRTERDFERYGRTSRRPVGAGRRSSI